MTATSDKQRQGLQKKVDEEKSILFLSTMLQRAFEVSHTYSLGRVSRTLRVYPVCKSENNAMIRLCVDRDILGLQKAFEKDALCPFTLDEKGNSLLRVGAIRF